MVANISITKKWNDSSAIGGQLSAMNNTAYKVFSFLVLEKNLLNW